MMSDPSLRLSALPLRGDVEDRDHDLGQDPAGPRRLRAANDLVGGDERCALFPSEHQIDGRRLVRVLDPAVAIQDEKRRDARDLAEDCVQAENDPVFVALLHLGLALQSQEQGPCDLAGRALKDLLRRKRHQAPLPALVVALERLAHENERQQSRRQGEGDADQEDAKRKRRGHSSYFLTLLCIVLSEMPRIFAARVLFPEVWRSVVRIISRSA